MRRLRLIGILLTLLLTLACDAVLLRERLPLGSQLAGLLLVFALPGAALLLALPDAIAPRDGLERVLLSFGLSIALAMLSLGVASLVPGLGIITRWLVVESVLIGVLTLVGAWQTVHIGANHISPLQTNRERVVLVALVLVLAALTRLPNLGYGEYYDDELDVVQSARSLLLGKTNVIFEHRKGPTEIWLTTAAAGTSTQFDEFTTRLPFAMASLGAIALTALVGEEFFGRGRGLLAAALLAGEGIFLAFSRMVQYQSIVLLMIVLVAWCALRFWRTQDRRTEMMYLTFGALCWSFGTLTHWDGALSGVLLAFVVLQKWKVESRTSKDAQSRYAIRDTRYARVVLIAVLAAFVPALFYIQLFLNPQVSNLKTYAGERIGFGIFNSVPAFMQHATFYDASPFIVALLAVVGLFVAQQLGRWRWLLLPLLAPFVWQDFLQVGGLNLSVLVFGLALIVLLRARTSSVEQQTLVLWLFAYFCVYGFVIRSAGLHFYTLMPALALIAATMLVQNVSRSTRHISRIAHYALRISPVLRVAYCVMLLLVAFAFDYVVYLNDQPEYALNYPQTALAWSPTFYSARPRDYFFGFPYRYGWSVIGTLYRQGVLRGKFESNETYLVTDWYLRDLSAAEKDEPRYYLRVNDSPRSGDVSTDLDEKFHAWGEVRVNGATKIQIYASNRYPPRPVQVFNAEQFPTDDDQLLARSLAYRTARGDDNAFRDLARYLDQNASAKDALVLDTALQDGIVPYYYRGDARMLTAPQATNRGDARLIFASLFAPDDGERWLALNAFPIESRWFGSVRLATYAPPLDAPVVQTRGAFFGYDVQLLDAQLAPAVLHAGDVLRLAFRWQTIAPIGEDFKIFIHVLDAQGNVIAQRDAAPMADLYPTSAWQVGEIVSDLHGVRLPSNTRTGALRIALGFYAPQSNERMSVRALDGQPLPDGQFIITGLSVQ